MKKKQLLEAYRRPNKKFCYFSGKNDPAVAFRVGRAEWDWTPQETENIEPFFWQTHTLALAMGCTPKITSEGKEWIEPLITDPSQVADITVPDVLQGRTGRIIDSIEILLEETERNVLVRLPDIQSPLGVAELMWHPDFFYTALLTHPNKVHELLQKITDFTISYIREIQNVCGDRLNPACFPEIWSDPNGYYIADDTNSLVSPDMHLAYSINYINKITRECGPLHYHSCTWTPEYFDNIRKLENVKAVNWATNTSIDPAILLKEFSGEYLICPHIGPDAVQHSEAFKDEADVVSYYLDNMQDNSTLYLWFQPELCEKVEVMHKIYQMLDEAGYAPSPN